MKELAADGIAVACRVGYFSSRASPTTGGWPARSPMPSWPRRIGRMPCSMPTARTRNSATDSSPGGSRHRGESMAERTAWRICRDNAWWSVFGKKRGRNGRRPGPPVHDDLVQRDFTAEEPHRLWLTGITEHHTREGKLYLCAIKDVHSGRIVGYSIDSRMKVPTGRGSVAQRAGPSW